MNLMLWLNCMASIVLQGLFPLTVDSPVILQPSNKTVVLDPDMESENERDVAIPVLDHVTWAVAEAFAKLIATFDLEDRELKLNVTDDETGAVVSVFTGPSFTAIRHAIGFQ